MFKKFSDFLDYFKYIENPFDALKFKFGISKSCELKLKNYNSTITLFNVISINKLMKSIPIIPNNELDNFLEYILCVDRDEKYFTINNIKFINTLNSDFIKNNKHNYLIHLEEFFTDDEWNMIDFANRHVIDIGGNVGDTSLYFASKGAEVISFEPVKHLHELAQKNIGLNPELSDKITLVNKGVGGKRGTLTFDSTSVQGYVDDTSYEMEIISIYDLLNNYEFTPDVLKMDCEGCEFEIILNENLTMFNDIIFEHHAEKVGKKCELLIEKLETDGFKIETYPILYSHLPFENIGMIYAYK